MRIFARTDVVGLDVVTTAGVPGGLMAGLKARFTAALAAPAAARAEWRTRAALAALDDHMLRDIGLTRHDVEHAIGRRDGVEHKIAMRG